MFESEQKIFKRLSEYSGKTQSELKTIFSIDSAAKNINEVLLIKMLGYDNKTIYSEELNAVKIIPKTIRIQKNGHIKESMSFPTFKFTEIVNESWEDSTIYRALHDTRFMFVVFEETTDNEYIFSRVKFWTISENDLLQVKKVWLRTVEIIREGVKLTKSGKITNNNLPKQTESPVAHVRPHAKDGNDTYPLPDGRQMVKQCFWLNRAYIEKIIKEIAEDFYDNQEPMSIEERIYLKQELVDDFYFLQDVNDLLIKKFGHASIGHINPQTLKQLGYICYPDYIIKDSYKSAETYFSALILGKNMFDLSEWDSRMIQATAAVKVLDALKRNFDILEYEDGRYVTYSHIHEVSPDITKKVLRDFVNSAIEYVELGTFFNTYYLRKAGFNNALFNLGFTDWFYDSIIKNSGKAKYLVIGERIVFHTSLTPLTTSDFIRYMLKEIRGEDIELFVENIMKQYGIIFSIDKIVALSKKTSFYYDSSMEKIYYSKEDFYDDL